MKRFTCVVLASMSLLTGCLSVGSTKIVEQGVLESIVENKTTSTEVFSLLGSPGTARSEVSGDRIWEYNYSQVSGFGVHQSKVVNLRIRNGVVIAKDISGSDNFVPRPNAHIRY